MESGLRSRRPQAAAGRTARISQAIAGRDLTALKQLARTGGGLETTRQRRRAWPLLLNFRALTDSGDRTRAHGEEAQLALDVPRARLPDSPELRRGDADAQARREQQLTRVVRAVLRAYPWLSYYQGFHELALVLLCVFGSARPAAEGLRMVALFFVRDAMASSLDHVMQQLRLLYVLLGRCAPRVHARLAALDVPPFFAISWVLTWFAHDVHAFADVCRIFDFLIATPPLQVVYVAAALVCHFEADILALEPDFAAVHSALTQLPARVADWTPVLEHAWRLSEDCSPTKLQHLGACHLPRLSAVNTFDATWMRLDPARPLRFNALVPVCDRHPLADTAEASPAADSHMARVIDLTSTAQKARALAAHYRWPLVVATVASATVLVYAWLLMLQLQLTS
ncbi:GTPase-activating protein gyp8 [Coemansia sp. RSA 2610]|nr:GTPase-activating protein gyp8 [Coemansia sp. RSA 2610]